MSLDHLRSLIKAHVKAHTRVINGRVSYVHDYDTQKAAGADLGHEASLHERTAIGKHKNGTHYLRATDSEDGRKIQAIADRLGIKTEKRRAGANHFGRTGAYDHYHVDRPEHAAAIHQELAKEADEPVTVRAADHGQGYKLPPKVATGGEDEPKGSQQYQTHKMAAEDNEHLAAGHAADATNRGTKEDHGKAARSHQMASDSHHYAAQHAPNEELKAHHSKMSKEYEASAEGHREKARELGEPGIPATAHKVGDKVRIHPNLEHEAAGQEGTVTKVHHPGAIGDTGHPDYSVEIPGHGTEQFGHGEVEAAGQSEEPSWKEMSEAAHKTGTTEAHFNAAKGIMEHVAKKVGEHEAKTGRPSVPHEAGMSEAIQAAHAHAHSAIEGLHQAHPGAKLDSRMFGNSAYDSFTPTKNDRHFRVTGLDHEGRTHNYGGMFHGKTFEDASALAAHDAETRNRNARETAEYKKKDAEERAKFPQLSSDPKALGFVKHLSTNRQHAEFLANHDHVGDIPQAYGHSEQVFKNGRGEHFRLARPDYGYKQVHRADDLMEQGLVKPTKAQEHHDHPYFAKTREAIATGTTEAHEAAAKHYRNLGDEDQAAGHDRNAENIRKAKDQNPKANLSKTHPAYGTAALAHQAEGKRVKIHHHGEDHHYNTRKLSKEAEEASREAEGSIGKPRHEQIEAHEKADQAHFRAAQGHEIARDRAERSGGHGDWGIHNRLQSKHLDAAHHHGKMAQEGREVLRSQGVEEKPKEAPHKEASRIAQELGQKAYRHTMQLDTPEHRRMEPTKEHHAEGEKLHKEAAKAHLAARDAAMNKDADAVLHHDDMVRHHEVQAEQHEHETKHPNMIAAATTRPINRAEDAFKKHYGE